MADYPSETTGEQRTALPETDCISSPAHLLFFVMQKSLSLSYSNLQFFLFTPCTPTSPIPVLQPNSLLLNPFIFIHTNTGLEPLAPSRYIARVAL